MEQGLVDVTGYRTSCSIQDAVDYFNKGILAFITLKGDSMLFLNKALEVDPDFLLAHCVLSMFMLDGLRPPSHPEVATHLQAIEKVVNNKTFNSREHYYIKATQLYASGNLYKSTDELTVLLMDYPLDALAIRFVAGNTITIGEYEKIRDMAAWTLAFWKEDMELYPYILAFYAFGLEETNEREKAEKLLNKVLEMNPATPWAHHAMSHVIEETHDPSDGVEFLIRTRPDWEASAFGGHITWHLTLYYFDMGDTESILSVYDKTLSKNVSPQNLFGLLDASSLLWRLNVSGVDPGEERWSKVTDALAKHAHNHRSPWFDTHIMMGLAHGKVKQEAARLALAEEMLQSMKIYSKAESSEVIYQDISDKLGVPVCTALLAFGQEKYDEVLQIMLPLRHDFRSFGGSWAQRQVFYVTLIQAAIKANKISMAKGILAELRGQKPCSRKLKDILQYL